MEISVKREKLIDILSKNREIHNTEYNELIEIYRNKVIESLENALNEAKKENGKMKVAFHDLNEPKSFVKEYDKVIGMLELSSDSEFSLNEKDYQKYVLDEWDWTHHFATSKSAYFN